MLDNLDLLNKKELSYILHNDEQFGNQFITQIEEYCQRKKYSTDKIKKYKPDWSEPYNRVNFEVSNDQIIISKTKEANRNDNNDYIFAIIGTVIIFFVGIWEIFTNKKYDFDFWYILLVMPFLITFLIGIVVQKRNIKNKSEQNRKIKIEKSLRIKLYENGDEIREDIINAVNLFWTDDGEAGSLPNVLLELKITERKSILIDYDKNYLELLRCGNEICRFLSMKLNIFNGNSPFKEKIEL